ncbi:MAG TPA: translation initiation factor IF-2 [Clostridia bacterium]|nr:MAG: Translation initiation factor IF-2 [Firmicutes bacterium ADurb.Bin146]HOD92736.1 translation initiation factor IF-2 [Clostridia bacterium]
MGKKVNELAKEIDKKASEVLRKLEQMGVNCNVNTVLTDEQEQKIYDIYRIKNTSTRQNTTTVNIASNDSTGTKTVVIKAPEKQQVKTKKDTDDSKPMVVVVKTTKGGETKSTIKHLKQEPEIIQEQIKEVVQKPQEKKVVVVKTPEVAIPKKENLVQAPADVKPEEAASQKVKSEEKTELKIEDKKEVILPQKTEQKVTETEKPDKEKFSQREEKKEKTYNEQKAYKDKTYIPKDRSDKQYPAKDNRTDKSGYQQRDNRTDRPNTPRSTDRPYTPRSTDRPYTPRPTDKKPGYTRTDSSSGYKPRPSGQSGQFQGYNKDKDSQYDNKSRPPFKKTTDKDKGPEDSRPRIEKPRVIKKEFIKKDQEKVLNKDSKKEASVVKSIASKQTKYEKREIITPKSAIDTGMLTEDEIFSTFYRDNGAKKRRKKREDSKPQIEILKFVKLPPEMSVKGFAEIIKKTGADVLSKLLSMGSDIMSINENIDFDTAALIADEFGITCEMENIITEEDILFDDDEDNNENLEVRSPVVVVMGHVDHGKTSLLDYIKNSNIAAKEAGRITQHIGAYRVKINDRYITFLDTPGHEAFTAMRKRGADVTDIAIITVAADDGIMPQTIEAINHAKAANVTIIIAINKIDLPTANPDRIMQQLMEHNLVATKYGGDIECILVSAKTGEGIDTLLDTILLSADILELKADPNKQAKGIVLESRVEKAGTVTTLLIQRGSLRKTDYIISGTSVGHIKALYDDRGRSIDIAGPSMPVEILGLDMPPEAGEIFYAVNDERTAKSLAERRKYERQIVKTSHKLTTLDDLFEQIKSGDVKDLNIIVKADVQGSVEAITDSFKKLSTDEVKVHIIHGAVGTITETDVSLAEVSNSIIVGFNVRPLGNVLEVAKNASVDIRLYSIIYDAIEDVKNAMAGMLDPKTKEIVYGHAQVRDIFKITGIGTVAGCMVLDGKILRNTNVRLVRDGITVFDGALSSLKRFKEDVKEVAAGYECGMSIEKFNDIKINDIIECYKIEVIKE